MLRKTKFIGFILLTAFSLATAQVPHGVLKGKVMNQNTKEELIGANVLIVGTSSGISTDLNGEFILSNLPVGNYSIRFSYVGMKSATKTDIQIRPERITFINVELEEAAVQEKDIVVTTGYFKNSDVANIGAIDFNAEEIKRSPGSMGDVSRILMALPSTAKISDESNDLAVRGGSPAENGFYVDGIPIPNINHFPNIGSTGGPIGILNIDFIEDVNFLVGGFSPVYSDRLSSVVDIQYRDGNREAYDFQLDLNMSGFGGVAEGPFPGKIGSWFVSARRSYLDLIMKMIGSGVAPTLGDVQGKFVFDLGKNHKMELLDIFADDYENYNREDALGFRDNKYGVIKNYQNTAGLSWQAIWNKNFFSVTTLSNSLMNYKNDFFKVSNNRNYLNSNNLESGITLRNTNYYQLSKNNKLEFGFEYRYDIGRYDYTRFSDTTRLGNIDPEFYVSTKIFPSRVGGFLNIVTSPVENIFVSLGIRADHYSLNNETDLSPRISVSYDINNRLSLNANTGIFYQQLPMYILSQKNEFQRLGNLRADHYGIGLVYLLTEDTKLTVDVYDKEYSNLPLDSSDPSLCVIDGAVTNNQFGNYTALQNSGKAFTRGVEIMIQKKMAKDIYGIISGSYFRSRYRDFNGIWRDRLYDNKIIFSVIGGYKPSRDWEFSIRWTYAGGVPYSPFDIERSTQNRVGIIDESLINSVRYPAYHSLNIRVDKKFYFSKQSIDVYLTVWNTYGRKNVSEYVWSPDKNRQETIYQWGVLPILGVEYEF